jgi:hypothetical protein
VKAGARRCRCFLTGLMNYGKEIIASSLTSQTSDKLPNPSRCERVNDAEPSAAMND